MKPDDSVLVVLGKGRRYVNIRVGCVQMHPRPNTLGDFITAKPGEKGGQIDNSIPACHRQQAPNFVRRQGPAFTPFRTACLHSPDSFRKAVMVARYSLSVLAALS